MSKIVVGNFTLTDEYVKRLLTELKNDRVKTKEDLKRYLRNYTYMNDSSRKCHLLISPSPKKENFAFPYDE